MPDFGRPFLGDVFETVWAVDGEAHQNDVCVGVREGPQTIIVLLPYERRRKRGEGGDRGRKGREKR